MFSNNTMCLRPVSEPPRKGKGHAGPFLWRSTEQGTCTGVCNEKQGNGYIMGPLSWNEHFFIMESKILGDRFKFCKATCLQSFPLHEWWHLKSMTDAGHPTEFAEPHSRWKRLPTTALQLAPPVWLCSVYIMRCMQVHRGTEVFSPPWGSEADEFLLMATHSSLLLHNSSGNINSRLPLPLIGSKIEPPWLWLQNSSAVFVSNYKSFAYYFFFCLLVSTS